MALKLRRNDEIIVLTGKNKGKKGIIKNILPNNKVIVSGINLIKKHKKPVPSKNKSGGIIEQESPLHISNIAIFNPDLHKADRVGFRFEEGKKVRFFKSTRKIVK